MSTKQKIAVAAAIFILYGILAVYVPFFRSPLFYTIQAVQEVRQEKETPAPVPGQTQEPAPEPVPEPKPVPDSAPEPPEKPEPDAISVAELIHDWEQYEGQIVCVAARMDSTSSLESWKNYWPYDDVPIPDESLEVEHRSYTKTQEGACVYITGKAVDGGFSIYRYTIDDAEITGGEGAKRHVLAQEEAWANRRQVDIATLPLSHGGELAAMEGQVVRTAVELHEVRRVGVKNIYYGRIENGMQRGWLGEVYLRQEDAETLMESGENVYVRVCGVVSPGKSAAAEGTICLESTYLEAYGQEVQEEVEELRRRHREAYEAEKDAYILSCEPLRYAEMARRPAEYTEKRLACTGTVAQVERGKACDVRLLLKEKDSGQMVHITYENGLLDDPYVLQGDTFTAYGVIIGMDSAETADGVEEEVLHFRANYANWSP